MYNCNDHAHSHVNTFSHMWTTVMTTISYQPKLACKQYPSSQCSCTSVRILMSAGYDYCCCEVREINLYLKLYRTDVLKLPRKFKFISINRWKKKKIWKEDKNDNVTLPLKFYIFYSKYVPALTRTIIAESSLWSKIQSWRKSVDGTWFPAGRKAQQAKFVLHISVCKIF